MSKKAELEAALKEAMKANDTVRKNTLRMALAAVKEAEVAKRGELDEAAVISILQKELKSRQEAMAEGEKANRPDLIETAKVEAAILEGYLPAGLSTEEIEAIVTAAIAESGASAPADMGKVMKLVLPQVQGRADGGQISALVKAKLQG
ncbi:MAG TPA: GatB/YqeY domain-containing protein [Anaerolineales bacterium]|nr:GatB/YqeY domain-containing protein [Anaerolineales bacterium]HRQ92006.1 GatB/YqeY domain-containing protein [Anaerolineales bacterium]